jgi:hypothetical protein
MAGPSLRRGQMEMKRRAESARRQRAMIGALALVALVGSACGEGTDAKPGSLTTFASSIYGYSIGYPSGWEVKAATYRIARTAFPEVRSPEIDYFSETAPDSLGRPALSLAIGVAGPAVEGGTTLDQWVADVEQLQENELACGPPNTSEDIQLGDEPGRLMTWKSCPAYILWAAVVHGTNAFHIWLVDALATDPVVQAKDRALFGSVLASFAFVS